MNTRKKWITIGLLLFDLIIIFGGSDKNGIMYNLIGKYLAEFMIFMSSTYGGANSVGFAIITLTAIFRLVLMPVALNQLKVGTVNGFKGQILKPEIEKLQEHTRTASEPSEQELSNTALVKLYDIHKFSPLGGISFISILIQIPFMSGVYSAINNTDALKVGKFFSIPLNEKSFLIAALVFGIYLLESIISNFSNNEVNIFKKFSFMMLFTVLLSPVLMFYIVFITKGAFGLYFIVNGIFIIIQNSINRKRKIKLQEEINNNFKIIKGGDEILNDLRKERNDSDKEEVDKLTKPNNDTSE